MGFELLISMAMLTFGTINTVSKKIMYQTDGRNIDGTMETYSKPWLCTLIMFLGEAMCLIAFYIIRVAKKGSSKTLSTDAFLVADPTGGMGYPKFISFVLLLSTCDLIQTTLTGIGLLYCPASITQILRGFLIAFVLGAARIFLKRVPKTYQLFGVCSSVVGLVFVGISAILNQGEEDVTVGDIVLGMSLTLFAQIFSSIQFVFEEKFMKGKDIPSVFLVGWEGITGSALCMCIFLPICFLIPGPDHGSYENFINSFFMMLMNPFLTGFQFLYFMSISFFNFTALTISKVLTATHRALVDALRTCFVWAVMVVVYYCTISFKPAHNHTAYGEPFTWYSLIELVGFLFMISGTLIHNNLNGIGVKLMEKIKLGDKEVYYCVCKDVEQYKKLPTSDGKQ